MLKLKNLLTFFTPDAKNLLIEKDPDVGQDWRQKEKGMIEDEMVGWHHWLDGHEFEQAPGVGDGQGSLECCSPQVLKESDMTEQLNWIELMSDKSALHHLNQSCAESRCWRITGTFPKGNKNQTGFRARYIAMWSGFPLLPTSWGISWTFIHSPIICKCSELNFNLRV